MIDIWLIILAILLTLNLLLLILIILVILEFILKDFGKTMKEALLPKHFNH